MSTFNEVQQDIEGLIGAGPGVWWQQEWEVFAAACKPTRRQWFEANSQAARAAKATPATAQRELRNQFTPYF